MKRKLSANLWKVIVILTIAIGLVVGVALPAVAAPDETAPQLSNMPPSVLSGRVISVDEDKSFFVIQSGEQEPVTITVDSNTKYIKVPLPRKVVALIKNRLAPKPLEAQERVREAKQVAIKLRDGAPGLKRMQINEASKRALTRRQELTTNLLTPGEGKGIPQSWLGKMKCLHQFDEQASFEDIATGDKVQVRLSSDENPSVAELVIIIKPTAYQQVSGIIDAVSDNSITITDSSPVILNYDENTRFILKGIITVKPGQSTHTVYDSENMMAKLVIVDLDAVD